LIEATIKKVLASLTTECSHLSAVVLRLKGEETEDSETYSLSLSKEVVHGKWVSVETPIDPHMIKHHRPCSEILRQDKLGLGMAAGWKVVRT
jgi:hypothetical protein